MLKHLAVWFCAALVSCVSVRALAAGPTTRPVQFIRCIDNGAAGGELDTADVTFVNDSGVTVHLIAAVHIGELSYYQHLQSDFAGYDAVLYELIKPKDAAPPAGDGAGEKATNVVSRFQRFLKDTLQLDYQLDDIDYTKPNFVHADLDKETFERMEAERGESIWTIMIQQMANTWSSAQDNPPEKTDGGADAEVHDLVKFLCRPDGERRLKMMIAQQMDQVEDATSGLGGPDGSVILTERNKAAINALKRSLAEGKRKIAIFYGAAHMPDLTDRLRELNFRAVDLKWRKAWDMTYRLDEPSNLERALNSIIDAFDNTPTNN